MLLLNAKHWPRIQKEISCMLQKNCNLALSMYGISDKNGNVLRPFVRPYVQVSTPVAKKLNVRTCKRVRPCPYYTCTHAPYYARAPLYQMRALVHSCIQQERDQRQTTYLFCIPRVSDSLLTLQRERLGVQWFRVRCSSQFKLSCARAQQRPEPY